MATSFRRQGRLSYVPAWGHSASCGGKRFDPLHPVSRVLETAMGSEPFHYQAQDRCAYTAILGVRERSRRQGPTMVIGQRIRARSLLPVPLRSPGRDEV